MAEARIDKWMWAVRIFKTRTIAAEACKKGRVTINGALVKAARMVKPGDELWDIARKYHTSIQEIRTINALKENQEPSPGTPLLVVKKVEGQIK